MQIQGSSLTGIMFFQNNGLKSTQEKLQRQSECSNKVTFYENQKNNLKNMECDSLEEISRKLELFHGYEDQIAAAKAEYNSSQVFHVLDEARERGEQIAEAAEKYAPKTPEERREEMVEEALGTDESKGELTESMEALAELSEELTEEITEEIDEEITEEVTDEVIEDLEELPEKSLEEDAPETYAAGRGYTSVDIRI